MIDSLEIPKGFYCYDGNGTCPFWSLNSEREEQNNGYCSYLKEGDWDVEEMGLLWNKVKLCSINEYTEEELLEEEILEGGSDICNIIKDKRDVF
jgi:hypothetical protein